MKTTYSNDTKYQFLQLRARGTSLGHISQQLGVPKSTLSDWDKQHRDEIHHLRAIEWEMLEEQFGRTIQHDLKAMAARIRKWETELDNLDPGYEDVPTMLKVLRETRREYFRLRDIIMAPIERADLGIVNRFSFSWANTVTAAHENATSNSPVTPDLRAKPRCKTESNSRGLTSRDASVNGNPSPADAVHDSPSANGGRDGAPPQPPSAPFVPLVANTRPDESGRFPNPPDAEPPNTNDLQQSAPDSSGSKTLASGTQDTRLSTQDSRENSASRASAVNQSFLNRAPNTIPTGSTAFTIQTRVSGTRRPRHRQKLRPIHMKCAVLHANFAAR